MIVDTMSYEEIVAEFKKDWETYFPSVIERHLNDNKYRRYMLKQAKDDVPVFFKPIHLTSTRGNKYILHINSKGRTDYKRKGFLFLVYMYFHRPNGIYAVLLCSNSSWNFDSNTYNIYIPHFFDRYRERELQDVHKPKMETIIDFFQNNPTGKYTPVDSNKYKDSIFFTVPRGVMLGSTYSSTINELRTYITFDMLKGNQINTSEDLAAVISEYMDKEQ